MKWLLVMPRIVHADPGCRFVPIGLAALGARLRALGDHVTDLDLNRSSIPVTSEIVGEHDVVVCAATGALAAEIAQVFAAARIAGMRTAVCPTSRGPAPGPDWEGADLVIRDLAYATLVAGRDGLGATEPATPPPEEDEADDETVPQWPFKGRTLAEMMDDPEGLRLLPLALHDMSADACVGFADGYALNAYGRDAACDESFEQLLLALSLDIDTLFRGAATFLGEWIDEGSGSRSLDVPVERLGLSARVMLLAVGERAGPSPTAGADERAALLAALAASGPPGSRVRWLPGAVVAVARRLGGSGRVAEAIRLLDDCLGRPVGPAGALPRHGRSFLEEARAVLAAAAAGASTSPDHLAKRFCARPFASIAIDVAGRKTIGCEKHLDVPLDGADAPGGMAFANGAALGRIRTSIMLGSFDFCRRGSCPAIIHDQLPDRGFGESELIAAHIHESPARARKMWHVHQRRSIVAFPPVASRPIDVQVSLPVGGGDGAAVAAATDLLPIAGVLTLRRTSGVIDTVDGEQLLLALGSSAVGRVMIESNGLDLTPTALERWRDGEARELGIVLRLGAGGADACFASRSGGDFDVLLENLEFMVRERRWGGLCHLAIRFDYDAATFRDMPAVAGLGRLLDLDGVAFRAAMVPPDARVAVRGHPLHDLFLQTCRLPAMQDPLVDSDFESFAA